MAMRTLERWSSSCHPCGLWRWQWSSGAVDGARSPAPPPGKTRARGLLHFASKWCTAEAFTSIGFLIKGLYSFARGGIPKGSCSRCCGQAPASAGKCAGAPPCSPPARPPAPTPRGAFCAGVRKRRGRVAGVAPGALGQCTGWPVQPPAPSQPAPSQPRSRAARCGACPRGPAAREGGERVRHGGTAGRAAGCRARDLRTRNLLAVRRD